MPKYNLSDNERSAQLRLRKEWNEWREEDPKNRTQTIVADLLGMNQSSLGAYLNGRNPINEAFLLKICTIMKRNPKKIYPELFQSIALDDLASVADEEIKKLIDEAKKHPSERIKLFTDLLKSWG